ncbi:unnamed protein product [Penicillium roqueforti FM164]|uniref:Uncharacterized protein n=1 Tax=Penicillium roqueforti (strain FM164) TaxID=1365484 RepID=W6QT41_PENRF|nr:unnamed protein product [Penicillium roqueforti FM164]
MTSQSKSALITAIAGEYDHPISLSSCAPPHKVKVDRHAIRGDGRLAIYACKYVGLG